MLPGEEASPSAAPAVASLDARALFNMQLAEYFLVLDARPGADTLIATAHSAPDAARAIATLSEVLDDNPPDRREVIVYGSAEDPAHARRVADAVSSALPGRPVLLLEGGFEAFAERYPFLCAPASAPLGLEDLSFFPSHMDDSVFVSGALPANDGRALGLLGVGAILNMTSESSSAEVPNGGPFLRLPMLDGDEDSMREALPAALQFVRENVEAGRRVLVHCHKGASRSVTVLVAWLCEHRGMTVSEALAHARASRGVARPLPGFERVLRSRYASAS